MNINERIVVASPYSRHDLLENTLKKKSNLEVLRIKNASELCLEELKAFSPKYIFFPHWSWKIPLEIYSAFECIVFHMTDLPYGRGGSPLQNLIVKGFKDTQLSAIRCVESIDAGPIYIKRYLSLQGTAEQILDRAAIEMIPMIDYIITHKPVPKPQVGDATFFKRRTPAESCINELDDLGAIHDYIRMLDADGYPKAFLETKNIKLEFRNSSIKEGYIIAEVKILRKES